MTPLARGRLEVALRVLLGLLLLWASVSKLANPTAALASIYAYDLPLPHALLKVVAVVLPWVELICGLMLVANHKPLAALTCGSALLLVFLLATGQAWARGLRIACGCFDLALLGFGKHAEAAQAFLESVGVAFVRNLLLAAGFLWLLRAGLKQTSVAASPISQASSTSTSAVSNPSPRRKRRS